ncbi:threonine-phosphate decarboxylase CobD [Trichocoleus sp. FACHB-262]|uniref:threonine-phosphate decarboxylase CobD n=1 Tax=Trichocoleus sp. FACHB-262 TaxID=2692869 RepID=UPI001683898A|nr:threonine-phosphate decarboxylase CobD [Trichocoleus sp. FACHB-262]MBD2122396.1 threonine-phosphate decarboxylase [Trichocoleus sp. FACHB-262]
MSRPIHGGNLAWAAALAGCPPAAILDFSASINPLGPPESAIAAIQAHLSELTAYPDPDYAQLRAVLGQAHSLPVDWLLPGNGAAELLTWACRDLSALEVTGLITPAFSDYGRALKAFNSSVLECPFDNFGLPVLDVGSVIEPLTSKIASQTRGLLINNPHNPTGQLFSRESILPYLEQFALVVVDEAFMDFLPPEQQQSLIEVVQKYPNLVILRSLTKFYSLPGLRLGYAIAHPERLKRWQQWRDPWPVNVLAAAAAAAVVQDTTFQAQTWAWLPVARSQLYQGLAQLPGLQPYQGAANFLLVKSEQPTVEVQKNLLLCEQILIRDCVSFPELGDRYFRVAVRTEDENQRLITGLAKIL